MIRYPHTKNEEILIINIIYPRTTLKIETGRSTRPKTEIYHRIYTYCNFHEVENETHFLCKCTYFTDERNLLYRICSKIIPEIQNMNHENILIELLSSEDPVVILATAKFIHTCLKKKNA